MPKFMICGDSSPHPMARLVGARNLVVAFVFLKIGESKNRLASGFEQTMRMGSRMRAKVKCGFVIRSHETQTRLKRGYIDGHTVINDRLPTEQLTPLQCAPLSPTKPECQKRRREADQQGCGRDQQDGVIKAHKLAAFLTQLTPLQAGFQERSACFLTRWLPRSLPDFMPPDLFPIERFEIFARDLDHPECLAFDRQGDLWSGGEAGQIYRITPGGKVHVVESMGGFCGADFAEGWRFRRAMNCGYAILRWGL
jgi:hypothetical protein